jgi:two-component system response regulator LytT
MEKIVSALVIDDDPSARFLLEEFLKSDIRVNVLEGLDSAVNAIETIESFNPDVIFLDINMPYENGLAFASRLKETNNNPLLIFCSAYQSYAIDAFELRPFDFITKPFGITEILKLIDKIVDEVELRTVRPDKVLSMQNLGKYKFKTSDGFVYLKPSEIIFVRSCINDCILSTNTGAILRIKSNLAEINKYICGAQFIKLSRSLIVNIDYIDSVDRKNRSCLVKVGNVKQEFIISTESICELEEIVQYRLG